MESTKFFKKMRHKRTAFLINAVQGTIFQITLQLRVQHTLEECIDWRVVFIREHMVIKKISSCKMQLSFNNNL